MTNKSTAACAVLAEAAAANVLVEKARARKAVKRAAGTVAKANPLGNHQATVNQVEDDRDASVIGLTPGFDDDNDAGRAEIADTIDAKTKAKPLRMKVPSPRNAR